MASKFSVTPTQNQLTSFTFSKKAFGKCKVVELALQASWFLRWKWLHYDEANDLAFYHTCMKASAEGKLRCKTLEPAFISSGFSNRKDDTQIYHRHKDANCLKAAVEAIITLSTTTSVGICTRSCES